MPRSRRPTRKSARGARTAGRSSRIRTRFGAGLPFELGLGRRARRRARVGSGSASGSAFDLGFGLGGGRAQAVDRRRSARDVGDGVGGRRVGSEVPEVPGLGDLLGDGRVGLGGFRGVGSAAGSSSPGASNGSSASRRFRRGLIGRCGVGPGFARRPSVAEFGEEVVDLLATLRLGRLVAGGERGERGRGGGRRLCARRRRDGQVQGDPGVRRCGRRRRGIVGALRPRARARLRAR